MSLKSSELQLIKSSGAALLIIAIVASLAAILLQVRIGVDIQKRQCIPYKVLLIHYDSDAALKRGDFVTFVTHGEMGHGFDGEIITKYVAGVPGDHVVVKDDELFINGKTFGKLDLVSKLHKPKGYFDRDQIVPAGDFFVAGTEPRTYDSRYWGFLSQKEVVGKAYKIPLISELTR
jgi:conjugal transfer pilin signal peptidase TrbI